jgi:hypothetical protein
MDSDGKLKTKHSGNDGFHTRYQWTKDGNALQVIGQVFLDTWMQKQYLPDDQTYKVEFKLSDPAFALHANDETEKYKINIVSMKMFIRQVQVSPSVLLGHAKGLQKHNIILPYNGHKLQTKLIKAGGKEDVTHLFDGIFPKCIVVGLVDHEAFSGKYSKSPYNFQHFDVCECGLQINGNPVPGVPYTPNFGSKNTSREYANIFIQLGKNGIFADDNGIKLEDWANGNTLYSFNLAPDLAVAGHAQPARLTNINLNLKFTNPIPKPLQLIALAIYDTQLELTKDRQWILDPTQQAN